MKRLTAVFLVFCVLGFACSKKESEAAGMDDASIQEFANRAYLAIRAEDAYAFQALCVAPGDETLAGAPFMSHMQYDGSGTSYTEQARRVFKSSLQRIRRITGPGTMEPVGVGRAIGKMPEESGFVGNIYVLVRIGGKEWALELPSSQMTQNRGRVFTSTPAVDVRTMEYYREITSEF